MIRDYRCYLLDEAHHIKKVEIIECRDDGEAERRAEEILAALKSQRSQVWNLFEIGVIVTQRIPAPSEVLTNNEP